MSDQPHALGHSNESLQQNLERGETAIFASYRVIGSILYLGAAGYFLDGWLRTTPWLLLGGLVGGVTVGLGTLARSVWRQ